MIKTEQLPGLWITRIPEGEVLLGVGAQAPIPYSGSNHRKKIDVGRAPVITSYITS
jgi:hypothetical protein